MNEAYLNQALHQYMLDVSLREHPVLRALREDTAQLPLASMQIPPEQAQLLQFLIRLLRAVNVLELGTFTGYSALAMALALPEHGHLITCDINPEWTHRAVPFWTRACVEHRIDLRLNPALHTLKSLIDNGASASFDLIFIDADKTNYRHYYEFALQLVAPTGLIVIDNVFWNGEVLNANNTRGQTREIRELNAFIKQDPRVHISLLPMGDGLFLITPTH